jgi:hypothetical protein
MDSDVAAWGATPSSDSKRAAVETSLWRWNLAMGILHLVQGIAVLAGSQVLANAKAFTVPMYTFLPVWTRGFPEVGAQFRFNFPFAGVTSGFAFMSAAAHFVVLATFQTYLQNLRLGINVHRCEWPWRVRRGRGQRTHEQALCPPFSPPRVCSEGASAAPLARL